VLETLVVDVDVVLEEDGDLVAGTARVVVKRARREGEMGIFILRDLFCEESRKGGTERKGFCRERSR